MPSTKPKSQQGSIARNEFAHLYLVDRIDFDPPIDKDLVSGRFLKSALAAGCPNRISVRSRMITAIAETKFSTSDGAPVALISLHGKDDLLVLGPAWALERVASGEGLPTPETSDAYYERLKNASEATRREISNLKKIPNLLYSCDETDKTDESNQDLRKFFRAPIGRITEYFERRNIEEFINSYVAEAEKHLRYLQSLTHHTPKYERWWMPWDDLLFTDSKRNLTWYPVADYEKCKTLRANGEFHVLCNGLA